MKKTKLLLLIISMLLSEASFGQNHNRLEIGLSLGPTIASLRGNNILDQYHSPKTSFSSGLLLQYNFKRTISLITGLAYENKGSKVKENEIYDNMGNVIGVGKGRTNFHYLSLPILIRKSLGKKEIFFLNAGPYFGYLIKQTFKFTVNNGTSASTDNTEDYKRTDFGIALGGGLKFPVNNRCNLLLEIRENLGLINVSDVPVVNNGSIKTNNLNLLFGIVFNPGK